jgi:hypothetical protein
MSFSAACFGIMHYSTKIKKGHTQLQLRYALLVCEISLVYMYLLKYTA